MFRSIPGIVDQPSLRDVWTGKQVEFSGRLANVLEHVPEEAYRAYQRALDGVADLLAYRSRQVVLQYEGTAQAVRAVYVSPNYFGLLGTQPAIGRLPDQGDTEGILVSDRFWRTQMAARPDAIGRIVRVRVPDLQSRSYRAAEIRRRQSWRVRG